MEFDAYDIYDIEYDRGGYDDSEDDVVDDHPTPGEVDRFWQEVSYDMDVPF